MILVSKLATHNKNKKAKGKYSQKTILEMIRRLDKKTNKNKSVAKTLITESKLNLNYSYIFSINFLNKTFCN